MVATTGGNKIGPHLQAMANRLQSARTVAVGFLENATYPNGTPVALIAAIQNYGAPRAGIPPRPFFSNMIARKRGEWPAAIAGLLKATDYDAAKTLKLTGEAVQGQLKQSIDDTNAPPLAKSTIARKGFEKPLVDSGHMRNSVDYEVKS